MAFRKAWVCLMGVLVGAQTVWGVELRLKYAKDQEQKTKVTVIMDGKVEVEGSQRISASATGNFGVTMAQKVLNVDDQGVGEIEFRLDGFDVNTNAKVDMGTEKHDFGAKINESSGTITADGKEEKIPISGEIKSQSWTVRMNNLGAPVGFDLDSSQMGSDEAAEVKKVSDNLASFVSQSAPLPEKDVKEGDTWENVLSIKELTASLAKDNPMLSAFTDLGIEDVKTVSALKELRDEGGSQLAAIQSTTNFLWKDGSIPLGIVNVTVNKLEMKNESTTEVNNTAGVIARTSSIATLEFDLVINSALGPEGPATYNAKGSIKLDSTTLTE